MDNLIDKVQGSKLLVTGGTGYLATNLIAQLRDVDCRIIRFGRPGAHFAPVAGKVHIQDIEGDIRERAIWEAAPADVDMVFHFAAQTSVYMAEQNPRADLETNVVPMLHLLETCRQKKLSSIVLFSGTVTEVGLPSCLPVDETHPDRPITVYDLHKWMAENYLKYYVRLGVVRGATLRLANVYGPGPKSSSADRGVLNMMINKALNGETLTVYGKGEHTRDYVYVEDVVRAFLYAAANIDRVNGQHFVIGSGEKYTIAEVFNLVADRVALKTGKRVPVVNVDLPPNLSPIEKRNFVADTRRFNGATSWRPSYSLTAGIDRTIESYLQSP